MKLTIFTPTYNRIKELPGLYKSIIDSMTDMTQKNDDSIEWIIVDDGSDYDITDTVGKFRGISNLTIKLLKKTNGGKHTAYNMAIDEADSDIFICVDDDDRLTNNAVRDIFRLGRKYIDSKYGGYVGRVVDENGKVLGRSVFKKPIVSNTIEIRDKYHFWGEPEIHFTKVLKKYRFDIFGDERFLTEAYLFDQMSCDYAFVYTNVPMMTKTYLDGGLTDNQLKIRMQCPMGCEAYYYKRKCLCKGFKHKLKATINRQRFGRYCHNAPKRKKDIYELIAMPVSWLMAIKDRHDCPNVV